MSGFIDKSVKIFDFNLKEVFCFKGYIDWVNCIWFDMVSRIVMLVLDDIIIKLWDFDIWWVIWMFEGYVGYV